MGRASKADGFILVAVLVLLVVLTLLAGMVALTSERAIGETRAATAAFDAELRTVSTRETVLFLFATQRLTLGGLTVDTQTRETQPVEDELDAGLPILPVGNEIRMDGTVYAAFGQARFAVQEDRGLLSPNWAPPFMRQRLFERMGVPAERWNELEAKRLDYQDADDLHRLGGAEASHYAEAGQSPPTNRPLETPFELRNIMGWREMLAPLGDATLLDRFTVQRNVLVNVNTAPAEVLALLPGMDDASAQRAVAMRQTAPFVSLWQFQQAFPLALPEDSALILYPNPSGNLKLWDTAGGPRRLIHWTMTPIDEGGRPWRIDYEVHLPRGNDESQGLARTPQTPLLAAPAADRR